MNTRTCIQQCEKELNSAYGSLAQTNIDNRKKHIITVPEILDKRGEQYLEETSNNGSISFNFEKSKPGGPHAVQAASRRVSRLLLQKMSKVFSKGLKILCIGASFTEMKIYKDCKHVHFYIADAESKDLVRTYVPVCRSILDHFYKNKSQATKEFVKKNATEIKEVSTIGLIEGRERILHLWDMYCGTEKRCHTDLIKADVLIAHDSLYNIGKNQLIEIFHRTGAKVMYANMCLPWQIKYPKMPADRYVSVKVTEEVVIYTYAHGVNSLGYVHKRKKLEKWFNEIVFKTDKPIKFMEQGVQKVVYPVNLPQLIVEFADRIGSMQNLVIFPATKKETVVRTLSLPDCLKFVQLLDIQQSYENNLRSCSMNINLVYYSMSREEYFELVQTVLTIDEKSRSLTTVRALLRRRMNGMSLSTMEFLRRMSTDYSMFQRVTYSIYLYTILLAEKEQTILNQYTNMTTSVLTYIKDILKDFMLKIPYVRDLLEWLLKNQLVNKVVLEYDDEEYQQNETYKAIIHRTRISDYIHDDMLGNFDWCFYEEKDEFDIPNQHKMEICSLPAPNCDGEQSGCDRCDEYNIKFRSVPSDLTTQRVTCGLKGPTVINFKTTEQDLSQWRAFLKTRREEEQTKPALVNAYNRQLEKMINIPMEYKVPVLRIAGGPGTGKSTALCTLYGMKQSDFKLVSPYFRLLEEYKNRDIPIFNGLTFERFEKLAINIKTHQHAYDWRDQPSEILGYDEYTAVDYRVFRDLIFCVMPHLVVLAGDPLQPTFRNEEEGSSIANHLDLDSVETMWLKVNYRNPANIVGVLNKRYYSNPKYKMISDKYERGDISGKLEVIRFEDFDRKAIPHDCVEIAYKHLAAELIFEKKESTVRSYQGGSYDHVILHITADQADLLKNDALNIVAISRHKKSLYIIHDSSEVALLWLSKHMFTDEEYMSKGYILDLDRPIVKAAVLEKLSPVTNEIDKLIEQPEKCILSHKHLAGCLYPSMKFNIKTSNRDITKICNNYYIRNIYNRDTKFDLKPCFTEDEFNEISSSIFDTYGVFLCDMYYLLAMFSKYPKPYNIQLPIVIVGFLSQCCDIKFQRFYIENKYITEEAFGNLAIWADHGCPGLSLKEMCSCISSKTFLQKYIDPISNLKKIANKLEHPLEAKLRQFPNPSWAFYNSHDENTDLVVVEEFKPKCKLIPVQNNCDIPGLITLTDLKFKDDCMTKYNLHDLQLDGFIAHEIENYFGKHPIPMITSKEAYELKFGNLQCEDVKTPKNAVALLKNDDSEINYNDALVNHHSGQTKLFATEYEFIENYCNDVHLIIYVGGAPGYHIKYLSDEFPAMRFLIIDPRKSAVGIPLTDIAQLNGIENKIFYLEEWVSINDRLKSFARDFADLNLALICDIRRDGHTADWDIICDNLLQFQIYRVFKETRNPVEPNNVVALMKYRPPFLNQPVEFPDIDQLDAVTICYRSLFDSELSEDLDNETMKIPLGIIKKRIFSRSGSAETSLILGVDEYSNFGKLDNEFNLSYKLEDYLKKLAHWNEVRNKFVPTMEGWVPYDLAAINKIRYNCSKSTEDWLKVQIRSCKTLQDRPRKVLMEEFISEVYANSGKLFSHESPCCFLNMIQTSTGYKSLTMMNLKQIITAKCDKKEYEKYLNDINRGYITYKPMLAILKHLNLGLKIYFLGATGLTYYFINQSQDVERNISAAYHNKHLFIMEEEPFAPRTVVQCTELEFQRLLKVTKLRARGITRDDTIKNFMNLQNTPADAITLITDRFPPGADFYQFTEDVMPYSKYPTFMVHPTCDSYLFSEYYFPTAAARTDVPSLNQYNLCKLPDDYRSTTVNLSYLTNPTNPRNHPIDVKKKYRTAGAGYGLSFDDKPLTGLKVAGGRYDTKRKIIPLTEEANNLAKSMVEKYFKVAKTMHWTFEEYEELNGHKILANFLKDCNRKNYFKRLMGEGGLDDPKTIETIRFHMKKIVKIFVSTKEMDLDKNGQGISAWSTATCLAFCAVFRLAAAYDRDTDRKDNWHWLGTDNGINTQEFAVDCAEQMLRMSEYENEIVIGDGKTYDALQDEFTQTIEYHYLRTLGLSEWYLKSYFRFRRDGTVIGSGFQLKLIFEKTSGEPATLFTNGIPMKVIVIWVIETKGPVFNIYKGDDNLLMALKIIIDEEKLTEVYRCTNLRIVLLRVKRGEFCGMIVCNGILVPNASRWLAKILAFRARDYTHFAEYQISLRDQLRIWNDLGENNVIMACAILNDIDYNTASDIVDCVKSWAHIAKEQWLKQTVEVEDYAPIPYLDNFGNWRCTPE